MEAKFFSEKDVRTQINNEFETLRKKNDDSNLNNLVHIYDCLKILKFDIDHFKNLVNKE